MSTARAAAAEALGTFFLVLMGSGAVMVDAWSGGRVGHAGVSLVFGAVVAAMVFALGDLSGAHINPAVTVALWSAKRFPGRLVAPYVAAQCLGAVAAAGVLRLVLGTAGRSGATLPSIPVAGAFGVELLLSFLLMLVVMAAATDNRAPRGIAPLAIGLAVGVCALVGGPLTGASMNPARSFGPALVGGQWTAHWLYWAAPIVGMLLAASAYAAIQDNAH